MVPAILFYEFIVIRNYADKFLPPTVLFYHFVIVDNYLDKYLPATFKSLFSNGNPRNLNKKNEKDKT